MSDNLHDKLQPQPQYLSVRIVATIEKIAALGAIASAQLRSLIQVEEPEPVDYPFSVSDIAQFHRISHDPSAVSVDEQTWSGLLVDSYFELLAGQLRIFGKQVLHHRLRDGMGEGDRAALAERLRTLMDDPERLEEIGAACRSLRRADTEIASLLFEQDLPTAPPVGRKHVATVYRPGGVRCGSHAHAPGLARCRRLPVSDDCTADALSRAHGDVEPRPGIAAYAAALEQPSGDVRASDLEPFCRGASNGRPDQPPSFK
jgi:hypothetical protein